MGKRTEKDTMGTIEVPGNRLYGAQTQRAVDNFPISGQTIGRRMIWALGLLKYVSAEVNRDLDKLDPSLADAIMTASREVMEGQMDHHFPVDIFQTGSGTSSNMNANEVIANRAIQFLGGTVGSKTPVHPNDHVNLGQSSNDVFPSAIHLSALMEIEMDLLPALKELKLALDMKSEKFAHIVKIGRTHLQDAVPMSLGQEFSGFSSQVAHAISHIQSVDMGLRELAIGGTAVGNRLNTHPDFGRRVTASVTRETGILFREATNHFEAQSARDAAVRMSGALKALAVSLSKIANDLRWLGSGPRLGLSELIIPPVQPGSSIMPGKVNPVIAEALIQVAAQVIGNDAAISTSGMLSHFQLNTMQPLIARNLLEQIQLLARGVTVFTEKLVVGLEANTEHISAEVEESLGMATVLVPRIGYEAAARIALEAATRGVTVRDIALEQKILPIEEIDHLMDHSRLIAPN